MTWECTLDWINQKFLIGGVICFDDIAGHVPEDIGKTGKNNDREVAWKSMDSVLSSFFHLCNRFAVSSKKENLWKYKWRKLAFFLLYKLSIFLWQQHAALFFYLKNYFGVKFIYNVILVSDIQQSESVLCIYIYTHTHTLYVYTIHKHTHPFIHSFFPFKLLQNIE